MQITNDLGGPGASPEFNNVSTRKYRTQDEVSETMRQVLGTYISNYISHSHKQVKWVVNLVKQSGWPKYSRERRAVYEYCLKALRKRPQ